MTMFNHDKSSLLGSELSAEQQRRVLRQYINRFTGDHKPAWANEPRSCGNSYPVQFKDDKEWLANTRFTVTKKGKATGTDCYSTPTWPEGKL